MSPQLFNIHGLNDTEVLKSREKHGHNKLAFKKDTWFFSAIKSLVKEPMVVLLLAAAVLYFITGKPGEGIFMASAIVLVAAISLYQDSRSRDALQKLRDFTRPHCKVIRNGQLLEIISEELVVGDSLMIEEGSMVAADGIIVHSNDFSVNESILTGESMAVSKNANQEDNRVFMGTTVAGGLAIATITATGNNTKLGNIGRSLSEIKEEDTPLEKQISNFVKKMVIAGALVFLIVWVINYVNTGYILGSLLLALTLAMSILPEEIPVAFTTFMALGARRLMKMGVVVKQMKTVETLGSATVICTDKTGTITENRMSLARVYLFSTNKISDPLTDKSEEVKQLIRMSMFASEPVPFDAMEIALHQSYVQAHSTDERPQYKMIHEYPLEGKPPMMTHIFQSGQGNRIIAAKGAAEALINVSGLTPSEILNVEAAVKSLSHEGYRVLGVGQTEFAGDSFPENQHTFKFLFLGLVAFYDPPKENIQAVFEKFYKAGIQVKIVTGDNAATTSTIARQTGFIGYEKTMTGDELMKLSEKDLLEKVKETQVFTRMYPEAKLRIINALKSNKEIVAMTGDGVNDGPALKAAHIGIAMGKKGSEIAKEAASLVLLDDDLSAMTDAVAMGRKIYDNLKKAIQYIISIHIPIILTVFIPLALGWIYPNIFTPMHVIFLELIMGPTCSVIYENEPMEKNTMNRNPRPFTHTFFEWHELATSIIQGVCIAGGTLFIYQYAVHEGFPENIVRTMVFTTLITANIFLTLVNRSFYFSIFTTLKYKNNLVALIIAITVVLTGLLVFVHPLSDCFEFDDMSVRQVIMCIGAGFISVIWFEGVKWLKRR